MYVDMALQTSRFHFEGIIQCSSSTALSYVLFLSTAVNIVGTLRQVMLKTHTGEISGTSIHAICTYILCTLVEASCIAQNYSAILLLIIWVLDTLMNFSSSKPTSTPYANSFLKRH